MSGGFVNREQRREYNRKWDAANRDKRLAYGRAYDAKRHAARKSNHQQAVERNRSNPIGACPKCGSIEIVKAGVDRKGRFPRQRWSCSEGHYIYEPREYPLGKDFISEPWRLRKALRLMRDGRYSLQKISVACGLDRYTIYKLHNHVGRGFICCCGRDLGHTGPCKERRDAKLRIKKPLPQQKNFMVYEEASRILESLVNDLKERANEQRKR